MGKSVKVRKLVPPPTPLTGFDPGEYLSGLEFYETELEITDADRDGLAQFLHFLAYLALKAKSDRWSGSLVKHDTFASRALESHFSHLDGWNDLAAQAQGISYPLLARFLMRYFPPKRPA